MIRPDERFVPLVNDIMGSTEEVTPVGHHHLGRNYVFVVRTRSGQCIVKFFTSEDRRDKEVRGLNMAGSIGLSVPRILDTGVSAELGLAVIEHLDGVMLDEAKCFLSLDQLGLIYSSLGRQLGTMHSVKGFSHFGGWTPQAKYAETDFPTWFRNLSMRRYRMLLRTNTDDSLVGFYEVAFRALLLEIDRFKVTRAPLSASTTPG